MAAVRDPIAALSRRLDRAPLDADLHERLLAMQRAHGDTAGAAAHELALAALRMLGAAPDEQRALALYNLATVYLMHGRHADACRWYRHTLAIAPGIAAAHQNLAVLLDGDGQPEAAAAHRSQAYRLQRVFVEPALGPAPLRLLILGCGRGNGNVPIGGLLPLARVCRIRYAIDYADVAEDGQLPPYDLVFNALGDADVAEPLGERLARFMAACPRPVLNTPDAVARTRRDRIGTLLAGIADLLVPACVRLTARPESVPALARELAEAGVGFPVLLRPAASHGGDQVTLQATPEALWAALGELSGPCYATAFHDSRGADGHYRKYRMIHVGGVPHAYHLAISRRWLVHYFSAEMTEHAWKLDEERRFLASPAEALGARAMAALEAVGARLGLDYAGIDFSLLPDGRVLVFEANATMLAHREPPAGPLAFKNPGVERIAQAVGRLLEARKPDAAGVTA
ncbi:ATP-grasp domain-containing protein [Burkholderia plantarii]|uniref:ATP-grasp domain-containing protein n=1 Tax=Burkholderia plantarii TaxID=41899 RepID=UPI0018DC2E9E|nr:hypothetical protein [Burkholderia plantarii]MBI0330642.1 hypothetical protein [Burkholderia plantarii]